MKKILIAICVAAVFAGCKKDVADDVDKKALAPAAITVDLVGEINVNTIVTANSTLQGIVYVKPGVTLTISPGVTISATSALEPQGIGVLIIEKGAKLICNGTCTSPIVWTTNFPPGSRAFGNWGGIIFLGAAPIITSTGAATNTFPGLNPSDPRHTYGGTNSADNSGSMSYTRLEFAGGGAPEIPALSFAGVGNGTAIHHVEVKDSGDDGFAFFGGTVNAHHLLSFSNKDDDFDFTEAYTGLLQFLIAYRTDLADNSGSAMIESDNNGAAADFGIHTTPTIANATLVGPATLTVRPGVVGTYDAAIYIRRASRTRLLNSLIVANAFPTALGVTPTTRPNIDNLAGAVDPSYISYNVWTTFSALPVVWDNDESNPVVDGTAIAAPDNVLIANLGNSIQRNIATTAAQLNLDGCLLPHSPLTSGGGFPMGGISPFFVNTVQRGAVLSNDVWTCGCNFISVAMN